MLQDVFYAICRILCEGILVGIVALIFICLLTVGKDSDDCE